MNFVRYLVRCLAAGSPPTQFGRCKASPCVVLGRWILLEFLTHPSSALNVGYPALLSSSHIHEDDRFPMEAISSLDGSALPAYKAARFAPLFSPTAVYFPNEMNTIWSKSCFVLGSAFWNIGRLMGSIRSTNRLGTSSAGPPKASLTTNLVAQALALRSWQHTVTHAAPDLDSELTQEAR